MRFVAMRRSIKRGSLKPWTGWLAGAISAFLFINPAWGLEEHPLKEGNVLTSVNFETVENSPTVLIGTKLPVGYRYTVYDSFDPTRVVIDFPGMQVQKTASSMPVHSSPIEEIRVSSFELSAGNLARVEIILSQTKNYDVLLQDNQLKVSFAPSGKEEAAVGVSPSSETAGTGAVVTPAMAKTPAATSMGKTAEMSMEQASSENMDAKSVQPAPIKTAPATQVSSVEIQDQQVVLRADGRLDNFKYFKLGAPPRLVVDVFGVKPGFKERKFSLMGEYEQVRVGTYSDKTRFVFDASGAVPPSVVQEIPGGVEISWGSGSGTISQEKPSGKEMKDGIPVNVESTDFNVENGKSVFRVNLSGRPQILQPVKSGDIVRFGFENGSISRNLRRIIDTSAFPSSVKLITPYTVAKGSRQDVLFAVELKGPTSYQLNPGTDYLEFVVENGPFAEKAGPSREEKEVLVPPSTGKLNMMAEKSEPAMEMGSPQTMSVGAAGEKKYTGQKISLVFDNADIRNILQLIGEVSDLNIIAGQDVKGTITLRLKEVPWDQALDLVMEIMDLGMIQEGNVIRILPKAQLRAMRQAEFTSLAEEQKLEPLVTETISVSYSDLKSVSKPIQNLLSPRGSLTEDARNKQIIVTDVPAVLEAVKKLVAILDTPERQVLIEARIVEANSSFNRDLGISWGLNYQNDAGGPWDPSVAAVGAGGAFLINPPAAGNVGGAGLGTGITFGRVGIDSTILDLRISALETAGRGRVISSPKVSTLNGQQAKISQGTKIPYQSSGTDGLPKTEFVDANLELDVTPEINPDDSIILDIKATNSSVGSNVATGSGTAPSIDTKEATTKVLVRDGETTVIGGIFIEQETESETGVPWLMHVPLLGHLFSSSAKTTSRSELLIFITPRIVQ